MTVALLIIVPLISFFVVGLLVSAAPENNSDNI